MDASPGAGASLRRPPPAHRATTAHLQATFPFLSEGGLGSAGPLIGRDLMGGSFFFDPWELYRHGAVTNPNLIVMGQVGRGKSTFVKTFVWRQVAFGRQAWVMDPKGEYGELAAACGVTPLKLSPSGGHRLNPLDLPAQDGVAPVRRRAELVASLVSSGLSRQLEPAERAAVDLAVTAAARRSRRPSLPDVVEAMLDPQPDLAASIRTDADGLAADGRAVALELRRLVEGDLAGMFDGHTTATIDLDAGLVVLDLSQLFTSPALPLLMTCAVAWMQAALGRLDGHKRLIVVDEAWAVLHDLATARWMQSVFKLSRAFGVSNVLVVHRLSDLRSAGPDGSSQQRLAEGLLADSETRVIFGQPSSEAAATAAMIGLTGVERDVVTHLPRGNALWKVGERSFLVQHLVGSRERGIVDTDAAMVGR